MVNPRISRSVSAAPCSPATIEEHFGLLANPRENLYFSIAGDVVSHSEGAIRPEQSGLNSHTDHSKQVGIIPVRL